MLNPFEEGLAVILPGAGSSSRMGSNNPKQYEEIKGKPLFMYALEEFTTLSYVTHVALVGDKLQTMKDIIVKFNMPMEKIILVQGSSTRHRSIKKGLAALVDQVDKLTFVLVHDVARPLVPRLLLSEMYGKCLVYGAVGLGVKLVSTIIRVDEDNMLEKALPRDSYLASETPQLFDASYLLMAYNRASENDLDNGTECLQLVNKYTDITPTILEGPPDVLWKVTHKKDLYTIEGIVRATNRILIVAKDSKPCVELLAKVLQEKFAYVGRADTERDATSIMTARQINTVVQFHMVDEAVKYHDHMKVMTGEQMEDLTIHVLLEPEGPVKSQVFRCNKCSCIQDLCRLTNEVADKYRQQGKGRVIVHHVLGHSDEHFVKVVTNIVMADCDAFSGQILYV